MLPTRAEAAVALPLVRREAVFGAGGSFQRRTPDEWFDDMTDDPDKIWRSAWIAMCARHAWDVSDSQAR